MKAVRLCGDELPIFEASTDKFTFILKALKRVNKNMLHN